MRTMTRKTRYTTLAAGIDACYNVYRVRPGRVPQFIQQMESRGAASRLSAALNA